MQMTKKLNNGIEIPVIAAGMWQIPDDVAERVVREAIEVGYRHIDTAQAYENEEGVGRGIRAAGIDRSEIFITSKILGETVRDYIRSLARFFILLVFSIGFVSPFCD